MQIRYTQPTDFQEGVLYRSLATGVKFFQENQQVYMWNDYYQVIVPANPQVGSLFCEGRFR